MDNDTYAYPTDIVIPYIISVKQFGTVPYCLPMQGSVAYSKPSTKSRSVYAFSAPIVSTDRYPITELVFCDYDYWVKIPYLGDNLKTGYVKCYNAGFDYETYVKPSKQTPNPQIGTNTDVIFNMWYFPNNIYKGVNYATPLYYQYFNGGENSKKCTLLSSISGLYITEGINDNPTQYLKDMTAQYWMDGVGVKEWPVPLKTIAIQNNDSKKAQNEIRKKAKENLNKQKPMLVGAGDGNTPHLVLVVGYKNCGANLSDYLVLDSSQKEFSDLQKFFNTFPKSPENWDISGGYAYGEY